MRRLTLTGVLVSVLRALGGGPFVKGLASAVALTLLTTSLTFAQTAKGSITGVVRDPNGAAVVGASVEATNEGTGDKRTATTNEDGSYTITNLDAGNYTLTVGGAGFAAATIKQVVVTVSF